MTISEFAGKRKPVTGPSITSTRLADQSAGPIIFVDAKGHRLRGGNVKQRMLAEGHYYRESLAGLHRLLIVNLAVLAGRDVEPDLVLVLEHDPIAADIFDAGLGIAGHDQMSRAEIASAVTGVPARHGKFGQIDLVAVSDIFEHWPGRHHLGGHRLHGAQARAQSIDQWNDLQIERQVERQSGALQSLQHVDQHAAVRFETRDVVENHRRRRGDYVRE